MPVYLSQLVQAGVLSVVGKSNKHTEYRLTDPDLVRQALAGEIPEDEALPRAVPDWMRDDGVSIFDPIEGYEDVKALFVQSVLSPRPTHVLLEGPPASAKTLFLMCLGDLPGAMYAVGGSSTKAGLADLLFAKRPSYLLVDELETIDDVGDYSVLLTLMESGLVTETKYRRRNAIRLDTRVYAACNASAKLPPALLSRFKPTPIRLREYTPDEFRTVTVAVLVKREGVDPALAAKVADATLRLGSRDVRFAVNLARLAPHETSLETVLETLRRRR
jgi:Holliday junction DNA helicase RuvB